MRLAVPVLLVAAASTRVLAGTQAGLVIDATTSAPIDGATVAVAGVETSTGADGAFELDTEGTGIVDVFAVADGYEPTVLQLRRGTPWRIQLRPDAALAGGELIVLDSEAPPVTEPPPYDLRGEEVRVLPGSGNDALKALQSLPGTARVPFGLGGLALRGAAPRDSAVYLDGIEVPILYHFGGLASFYPSGLLGSMELSPSGFSSRYGRAQGGLVELASRPARTDRWRVGGEVSLVDAQVRAEGPASGGGGWTLGVRRSYVDAVLAAAPLELTLVPRYWDAQLKYETGQLSTGKWSAIAFGSSDRLELVTSGSDPTAPRDRLDYTSQFLRAGVRYQRERGPLAFDATLATGVDDVSLAFNGEGVQRRNVPLSLRASLTRTFGDHGRIAGGLDLLGSRYSFDLAGEAPARPEMPMQTDAGRRGDTLWSADAAAWTELQYPVAGRAIVVTPGLRAERFGLSDEWTLDPRLAIGHELTKDVIVTESIGLYHQPVNAADLDPALGSPVLHASRAIQTSVGVTVRAPRGLELATTAYGQTMRDLPADTVSGATPVAAGGSRQSGGVGAIATELADEQFGTYSYKESVGRGRAWGLEVLLRKRTGAWTGWVGYTYARSLRRGDPARESTYLPYVLDQPHQLVALASVPLGARWRLGARVRYATGNPYTPIAGAYFDADRQRYRPRDGALLSSRLPAFVQVDVRIDREWRPSWGVLKLFLDVQNVTNRANPEGVTYNFDYTERSYTRGLPVFPSFGLEYIP